MVEHEVEIKFSFFKWNPRWYDIAPIGVWILSGAVLQIARMVGPLAPLYLEWINPLVDLLFFVFPILFLRLFGKEGFSFVGVSKKRIWAALILGLPLGLFLGWMSVSRSLSVGQYLFLPPTLNLISYALTALFHLLAVEFFYRGWLASILERSYGFVAAVFISGLLYGLSPLFSLGISPALSSAYSSGVFFWGAVFPFTFLIGALLATIARLTRNLLAPVLAMLPQTLLGDFVQNGAAHRIFHPASNIIGIVALFGIVIVILWITKPKKTQAPS
jgi:membrane protease YdiL (CAAX protease family)